MIINAAPDAARNQGSASKSRTMPPLAGKFIAPVRLVPAPLLKVIFVAVETLRNILWTRTVWEATAATIVLSPVLVKSIVAALNLAVVGAS